MTRRYGLAFPLKIENGVYIHPTLTESLNSSLSSIISWFYNNHNFLNTYGSILYLALGKPHTEELRGTIEIYATKAVRTWEPRLTNIKTEVEYGFDWVKITVTGTIKQNQQFYNYSAIL